MTKVKKGDLKISFLLMAIIPIIAMGIIIATFSSYRFKKSIETEVRESMVNMAYVIANTFDNMYPGDYSLAKSDKYVALKKGEEYLTVQEYLEHIKEDTDTEITVFYGNTRMITTLVDSEGNSLQGTNVNYAIEKAVIKEDTEMFYTNVNAGSIEYYAYYLPIHNSDGSVVGMIAILKNAEEINILVRNSVYPIYIISAIVTAIAGLLSVLYSQRIINHFDSIKKYFVAIKNERQEKELDYKLLSRKDELGEMANAAVDMRKAIKKLTELDALTAIYNRRYAKKDWSRLFKNTENTGGSFSVCISDIDFFKKVNDTYGHNVGDTVLVAVATELKNFMRGLGFAARWGGEEFLIVFEKEGIAEAEKLLNKLRERISEIAIEYEGGTIQVTMSFGVADAGELNMENVIKLADERLYDAKEGGRNLVVAE